MFPSSFWDKSKNSAVDRCDYTTHINSFYCNIHYKKDISVCHVISILCFNHMAKYGTITYLIQCNLYFLFTSFTMF